MDEKFTAEEQAAMDAMKADTGEAIPEPIQEEPKAEPPKEEPKAEEPKEPEFKTTREKAEKPPEGFVPHQAMHAERMKRQELERKVAELEALIPKPEAEKPPELVDPLVDPEGFKRYDQWQRAETQKQIQALVEERKIERETAAKARKAAELEAEFARETTDYPQATAFLHQARVQELASMGYTPEQIGAQLREDATNIFNAAEQIGMNPAELLYIRAKRAGYAAPAPQIVPDEAEKVIALDRAQKQTQGLGSVSGPQSGELTATDLANMTEAELAKVPADVIRKVMGG